MDKRKRPAPVTVKSDIASSPSSVDSALMNFDDVVNSNEELFQDCTDIVSIENVVDEIVRVDDKAADEKYLCSFPPGYRFAPRDDELIEHYLMKKIANKKLPINKIRDVNIYKYNPRELAAMYKSYGERENEWYFFTSRDRKYPNGTRPNRAAGNGYWKATGADKEIFSKTSALKLGCRKALVFYEGKPPKGIKSKWIMHEYRIDESPRARIGISDMRLDDWVLCRIKEKIDGANVKTPRKKKNGDELLGSSFEDDTNFMRNSELSPESYEKKNDDKLLGSSFEDDMNFMQNSELSPESYEPIFDVESIDEVHALCEGIANDSRYDGYFLEPNEGSPFYFSTARNYTSMQTNVSRLQLSARRNSKVEESPVSSESNYDSMELVSVDDSLLSSHMNM
ncbi:hypothetical protein ACHQM5_006628 [Ranunculus cassubicifolius]